MRGWMRVFASRRSRRHAVLYLVVLCCLVAAGALVLRSWAPAFGDPGRVRD